MTYTKEHIIPSFRFRAGSYIYIVQSVDHENDRLNMLEINDHGGTDRQTQYPIHIIVDSLNQGQWVEQPLLYEIY